MASAYFTMPSFARARKNKEQLEKTNPKQPVLKDEDVNWLEKQVESDKQSLVILQSAPTKIFDDGVEQSATTAEQQQAGVDAAQVVIPEDPPQLPPRPTSNQSDKPDASTVSQSKKSKTAELPSQEEAEAMTKTFNFNPPSTESTKEGDKKGWTSYLPTIPSNSKKTAKRNKSPIPSSGKTTADPSTLQAWSDYAQSYLPKSWKTKDKDAQPEPILNPDGSINETATQEKQEREFAVLLDNLNMSTINNHVFSFSDESRKLYERFTVILHDTINGVPTAYDDMEKFMREAGPILEKQFKAMPPFVQTLVKSLPAKISASLAPELLAATSEKPGADLKAAQAGSSKMAHLNIPGSKSKSKRRIPSLKSLLAQQGAVAGILKNILNFIRVRFPFLASTTSVVMSLAVSILMFVLWYCHKRGKEVRLAREAEAGKAQSELDDNETSVSATEDDDDDDEEEDSREPQTSEKVKAGTSHTEGGKDKQKEPAQVPLPK